MALSCGCGGRLTALFGVLWPGQQAKFDGKNKAVPLNKAEICLDGTMSNPQTVLDTVGMVCFGNQISVPSLRIVQPLCAVDCYPIARRITSGLASMDASPEEHLRDAKRALGDTAWAEWRITAAESTNEERAQHIFFEEELQELLQVKLCNAADGLQPGADLDAVLKEQKAALEAEATRYIVANWETDYESREVVATMAPDAERAESVATLFNATVKLHVAVRVDPTADAEAVV